MTHDEIEQSLSGLDADGITEVILRLVSFVLPQESQSS